MLQKIITSEGIVFLSIMNGKSVFCNKWFDTDDCIYYLPLSMLADNGNATIGETEIVVPFECVYLLNDFDMKLLDIPPYYKNGVRMFSDGTLKEAEFKYKIELVTSVPNGDLIPFDRKGNVVETPSGMFLLHEGQYRLFEMVDGFNQINSSLKIQYTA